MSTYGQLQYDTFKSTEVRQGSLAIGVTINNRGEFPVYTHYKSVDTEDPEEIHELLLEDSGVVKFDEILLIRNSTVIHHFMEGRDYNIEDDQL